MFEQIFAPLTFAIYGALVGVFLALLLTLIVAIPTMIVTRKRSDRRSWYARELLRGGALAAALGVLGWVTGYFTGDSRASAVGQIIPAVLGGLGAIGGFAGLRYGRAVSVGLMIGTFSLSLFVGAATGASIRETHDLMDNRLPPLEEMEREADKEASIKEYRRKEGLPWPPDTGVQKKKEKAESSNAAK
jgi:hypothetical protein